MAIGDRGYENQPFEFPFHLNTLNRLGEDARLVLWYRAWKNSVDKQLEGAGYLQSIDTARFPKGSYEYGLQVSAIERRFRPDVAETIDNVSALVNNGGVLLLPTPLLRGIDKIFRLLPL